MASYWNKLKHQSMKSAFLDNFCLRNFSRILRRQQKIGRTDDFDYGQNFSRFLSSYRSSVKVDRRVGRQIFFKNKNKNAKYSEFHALSNHK